MSDDQQWIADLEAMSHGQRERVARMEQEMISALSGGRSLNLGDATRRAVEGVLMEDLIVVLDKAGVTYPSVVARQVLAAGYRLPPATSKDREFPNFRKALDDAVGRLQGICPGDTPDERRAHAEGIVEALLRLTREDRV